MQYADVSWLYQLAKVIGELGPMVIGTEGNVISEPTRQRFLEKLQQGWHDSFDQLGLIVTNEYVDTIIKKVNNPSITYGELHGQLFATLQEMILHELKSALFLHVPAEDAKYFQNKVAFGQQVSDQFPSAGFDIEEAANCLALGRSTACVMHLARVVEVGLKSARMGLQLPPLPIGKQSNWGEVLHQIWDEVGSRNKAADPVWMRQEKPFYENVHSDLSSVKNAWRNPSMHADKSYDAERAGDIFNMTKSFMRHLAQHLDEAGKFSP
jgi:hypothetical protein